MPNDYFQFKQFTIRQDNAAMKVCTDSCLFGAWVAAAIIAGELKPTHILDIGAGTGLLSTMLAQHSVAAITAIEIDEQAALQAQQNFAASPWPDRLQVVNADVKGFKPARTFDLIISNPPFYADDLKSNDARQNLALHSEALTFKELLDVVKKLLEPGGSFAVLLPYSRTAAFALLAKQAGLYIQKQMLIKQTEKHLFFRAMLLLACNETVVKISDLMIKDKGKYSTEFIELLRDYYLYL